jgi:flavin-dependent dehydrogenase
MHTSADTYDVIIAGGGPAGSSASISLANRNVRVLLVEQKQFPRAKLCGEFISPECRDHFQRLGIEEKMMSSNPALLTETVFYSRSGHSLTLPSRWFGGGGALGLSRAVMDNNLLQRAREVGVAVHENASITEVIEEQDRVRGLHIKSGDATHEYRAPVIIDATGRARALTRKVKSVSAGPRSKPKLVAFKAHLEKTRVAEGACEVYFYSGGYGGLSTVEGGVSNLCFISAAADVRRCHSDPEAVLRDTLLRNRRAAYALETASVCSEWLSVSLDSFGRQRLSPAKGLLAIGDSAAFIDPFTGSGMLMALESGELASRLIVRHLENLEKDSSFTTLVAEYNREYRRMFDSRLRICGLLRRAAFTSSLAEIGIVIFGASERLRSRTARATRSGGNENRSRLESAK